MYDYPTNKYMVLGNAPATNKLSDQVAEQQYKIKNLLEIAVKHQKIITQQQEKITRLENTVSDLVKQHQEDHAKQQELEILLKQLSGSTDKTERRVDKNKRRLIDILVGMWFLPCVGEGHFQAKKHYQEIGS
jgi:predicted RNase H-like nuclease (RuvC/YqgF family)